MQINQELKEYFKNLNVEINFYPEDNKRSFRSLDVFYKFIKNEHDYWQALQGSNHTNSICGHFAQTLNHLNTAIKQTDLNQAQTYIKTVVKYAKTVGFPCIYSKTFVAKFIAERHMASPLQAEAAIDFLIKNSLNSSYLNNKEYFTGLIYSIVINGSMNEIAAVSVVEKEALKDLRKSYFNELDTLHSDYLSKSEETSSILHNFQEEISSWKVQIQQDTTTSLNSKEEKFIELENTYKEHLRLEGPATYWEELFNEYTSLGNKWRKWVLITSAVFFIFFTGVLFNLPDSLLGNRFTLTSIKATLIMTLIASVGIYVIRLFINLSLSDYHLARDAKERLQLTHVFLSLLNEKAVKEDERSIILQAIFSRAETGLLKGDSSPTLPDNILSQLVKNIQK